jgi:hypothetical protein
MELFCAPRGLTFIGLYERMRKLHQPELTAEDIFDLTRLQILSEEA